MQDKNPVGERAGDLPQIRQSDLRAFVGVADHQEKFALARDALGDADEFGIEGVGNGR